LRSGVKRRLTEKFCAQNRCRDRKFSRVRTARAPAGSPSQTHGSIDAGPSQVPRAQEQPMYSGLRSIHFAMWGQGPAGARRASQAIRANPAGNIGTPMGAYRKPGCPRARDEAAIRRRRIGGGPSTMDASADAGWPETVTLDEGRGLLSRPATPSLHSAERRPKGVGHRSRWAAET